MVTCMQPMVFLTRSFLIILGCVMCWTALSIPTSVWAQSASEEDILVDKARFTLDNFLSDPDMQWFRDHLKEARGILVVPQFIKGAFFIGGSGGSGVLIVRDDKTNEWSYPAFFTLGGASFGLQFGGQASEIVLLVMTQKGVDSLMSTTLKLGADASVAVGPIGRGVEGSTAPNLSADLLSFSKAKGLFAGISLEGAVVAARDALNTNYYKEPTKTIDILVRRSVSNPQAAPLLALVKKATKGGSLTDH
ncbi:MAG: lipid-binding SYLF domain-containing protein [Nitrospirales bacterium]|nr:lipid-binding SYLF domain-containing protein [Nitrospirales bacterium]